MQLIVGTCRKTPKNSGSDYASLSRRDLQLALLVADGYLNKEISYSLGITEGTVKVYLSNLFAKLGIGNRAELAAWTVRHESQLDLRANGLDRNHLQVLSSPVLPGRAPGGPS